MAVSINDLVDEVRDLLSDNPYVTTSQTVGTGDLLDMADYTKWTEGDIGEFQTGTVGYEQFYVTDATANPIEVVRGYNGTTAEAHSIGVFVHQNPIHQGRQVQAQLLRAVNTLWPYVYKVDELTVVPLGSRWYDLDAETVGIVRVSQEFGTGDLGRYGGRGQYSYQTDFVLPNTTVASGRGISFPRLYDPANDIVVLVQKVVTGASDIETGPQFPVADYVVTYAAGQLTGALEIPRVSEGADLEVSGTVGSGDRLQTGAFYASLAKQKLEQLAYVYKEFYKPVGR